MAVTIHLLTIQTVARLSQKAKFIMLFTRSKLKSLLLNYNNNDSRACINQKFVKQRTQAADSWRIRAPHVFLYR